jgi:DNA repair exonuclease SbcCD ATPase subunit
MLLSSEYEYAVSKNLTEKLHKLQELQNNDKSSKVKIDFLKMEIESLESLYENYNYGMNYFRRAQGGRDGLREVHDKL